MEACLRKNNSKRAYQLVKDQQRNNVNLQPHKTSRGSVSQRRMKSLTGGQSTAQTFTTMSEGDPIVLDCPQIPDKEHHPILQEEVETAVKALKTGKSAGVDNIPAELVQAGGDAMIDILTTICNKIWKTGEWPTTWTQSLDRTISLISHPSKVMLKIILNRLQPQSEEIIAEEQAGFRAGRSTTEQIFNLRILGEKYLQHQQNLYHVFTDFQKAFDRASMRKYNINASIIRENEKLHDKAQSAVLFNDSTGEWFRTTVGVRQWCLLSPTLFNIFLERNMCEALDDHEGSVSIGGRLPGE